MNYYPHHLGDYAKDTGTLTMLEHGAYRLLLDAYYSTEQPIPQDEVYRAAKAVSKADRAAVDYVLKKFFTLTPAGFFQRRADREIAILNDARERARNNGNRGGRPVKQKPSGLSENNPDETQRVISGFPNDNPDETQPRTTRARPHEPTTHEPNEERERGEASPSLFLDAPCTEEEAWSYAQTVESTPGLKWTRFAVTVWWNKRDTNGWRKHNGRPVVASNWQSDLRDSAGWAHEEASRAIKAQGKNGSDPLKSALKPDKWGKTDPNAADAKKLSADLAKQQRQQAVADEKLKAGERMTPEDIAAMKAEILTQTPV
jgi:uncharacterized protein YdaU (DUF1376 family)